jgi:hypothetical protein
VDVTLLGGGSGPEGSPRVWATDRGTLVVQGYRVEDAEALAKMNIPGHETCVEIPRSLLPFFPRVEE